MKDLFEYYEEQPKDLKLICDHWADIQAADGLSYKDCAEFLKQVQAIGYTFDYGLDSEPYELQRKKTKAAKRVLRLLDQDEDANYQKALNTALREFPDRKKKDLETELNHYV